MLWTTAVPHIERAMVLARGRYTIDQLRVEVDQGKQNLWGIVEDQAMIGAFTTKVYEASSRRICCVEWLGGGES